VSSEFHLASWSFSLRQHPKWQLLSGSGDRADGPE
jgi:hypothetical protein